MRSKHEGDEVRIYILQYKKIFARKDIISIRVRTTNMENLLLFYEPVQFTSFEDPQYLTYDRPVFPGLTAELLPMHTLVRTCYADRYMDYKKTRTMQPW
jgi:hypothetical protein